MKSDKAARPKGIPFSTVMRWFRYLLLLAIPVGLYFANAQLEHTRPQREAAARENQLAYDKAHPKCFEVQKTEVRDKDDKLVRTEVQEREVRCEQFQPRKPFWDTLALWEKIVYGFVGLVVCVVAIIWGGGLAIFALSALLG